MRPRHRPGALSDQKTRHGNPQRLHNLYQRIWQRQQVCAASAHFEYGVKMKTLVVDDNADDRKILRYLLERRGCEVIEATNGEEGLTAARVNRPALIISDALMPKMDGF